MTEISRRQGTLAAGIGPVGSNAIWGDLFAWTTADTEVKAANASIAMAIPRIKNFLH
jgi:hypothetical protein